MTLISPELQSAQYIHEIELKVDDGNGRHIGNVEFFQFFNDAREAYLPKVGCPLYDKVTGFGHMVVSNHCDYKAELAVPDHLLVGVEVLTIGAHTIKLGFDVFSTNQQQVVAQGYTVVITFNFHNNSKVPVSQEIRDKIAANVA